VRKTGCKLAAKQNFSLLLDTYIQTVSCCRRRFCLHLLHRVLMGTIERMTGLGSWSAGPADRWACNERRRWRHNIEDGSCCCPLCAVPRCRQRGRDCHTGQEGYIWSRAPTSRETEGTSDADGVPGHLAKLPSVQSSWHLDKIYPQWTKVVEL